MNRRFKYFANIVLFLLVATIPAVGQLPKDSYSELHRKLKAAKTDSSAVMTLVELSRYFYFKPAQTRTDQDSSLFYANKIIKTAKSTRNPIGEALGYQLLGIHARSGGNIGESRRLLNLAIALFEGHRQYLMLGEALFDYAVTYNLNDELPERIRYTEKSKDAFQRSGSMLKQADINKELADILESTDETRAFFLAQTALELYKSAGHEALQGIYDLLGTLCFSLGDYDRALEYGIQALNTAKEVGDTSLQLATIHNRIGLTFNSVKKVEQALEHFIEGIRIAKIHNDPTTIKIITCNRVSALTRLKKTDEALKVLEELERQYPDSNYETRIMILPRHLICLTKLGRLTEGQKYCKELLNLLKATYENYAKGHVYNALAQYYIGTKQYDLARKYIIMMDKLPSGLPPVSKVTNLMRWFQLDSTQGRWPSAIKHYQIAKAIEDSAFSQRKNKHVEFLEMQLATEKRDNQIKQKQQDIDLLQQQDKIREESLAQGTLITQVIAVGVMLTLMIISLLVINVRHRNTTHQKFQEKQQVIDQTNIHLNDLVQEKAWLVNEIHHRVNNNFTSVISLLDAQKLFMTDPKAIIAMEESQHRIQTMALVHEKLFASGNFDTIRIDEYITNLIAYIRESLDTDRILTFVLSIPNLTLHFSYGQPLGMIICEAVTNAIKYAFPDGRKGIVSIIITEPHQGNVMLTIKDNGIGFPHEMNADSTDTMGMNLIRGLCREIDATLQTYNENGAILQLSFTYEAPQSTDRVSADNL